MALLEQGFALTRSKAQALIMAGQVMVNEKPLLKPGTLVNPTSTIKILSGLKYVSRGGEKLEGALEDFRISVQGKICLDVGSSTGGFTDCLIKRGAARVYAVDVGTKQFDSRLKNDSKIVLMEETHIKDVTPAMLDPRPSLVVIDVSFISLTKVLPTVACVIQKPGEILAMVKPQFEVGPKFLKKGVVRSEEKQREAVESIKSFAGGLGLEIKGTSPARIKGPTGNQEYFLYLYGHL